MTNSFLFCLLVALFAFQRASAGDWGFPEEDNVIVLDQTNFEEAIGKFDFIMIEFYAPWCNHCKKLEPIYSKIANRMKKQAIPVPFAKIDGPKHEELMKKFEVEAFPTLLLFKKGTPLEYTGMRNMDGIINFLTRQTTRHVSKLVESAEEFKEFYKNFKLFVMYFGPQEGETFEKFLAIGSIMTDIPFVHSSNEEVAKLRKKGEHTLVIYKKFDEREVGYEGNFEAKDIAKWIQENRFPYVAQLDQMDSFRYFSEGNDLLVVFAGILRNSASVEALVDAGDILKGKITMAYADFSNYGSEFAAFMGADEREAPIAMILSNRNGKKIKYRLGKDTKITTENLVKFYEDFKEGKLAPYFKSQEAPEQNNGPVKVLFEAF